MRAPPPDPPSPPAPVPLSATAPAPASIVALPEPAAPPLASEPARQTPCSQRWDRDRTVQSTSATHETSQTPGALSLSATHPGTHCAVGRDSQAERSAHGSVHTPHTHVS